MKSPRIFSTCSLFFLAIATLFFVLAGLSLQAAPQVKVKFVPMKSDAVLLFHGEELYAAVCATCHGENGAGNGPVASAMKVPPTNLTLLARQNGGKFPTASVRYSIVGDEHAVTAHGTVEMPVWGSP